MVPKEKQFARSGALVPFDANRELTRLVNIQPNEEIRLPEQDNNVDECSKILFPEIIGMVGGEGTSTKNKDKDVIEHVKSPEALEKQDDIKEVNDDSNAKEGDDPQYSEEEDDPDYILFLEHLKSHEKSYVLECEEDGVPVILKYEEDIDTTSASTLTHKKSRSKAEDASSVGSSATSILKLTHKKSRSMAQSASTGGSSASSNLKRAKTRKQ